MKVEELQVNITNQNITDIWNDPDNEILEWGFLALPRTLIWLHRAIGITSNELVFIITVHSLNDMGKKNILDREIAGYNFNNLSDEVLEEISQVITFLKIKSSKDYWWERRQLKKKGYLKTTVAKPKYDMNTKRFVGQGVEYDFTGLITALKKVKKIIKEKSGNRKNKNNEANKNTPPTTPADNTEKKNNEQSKKENVKNEVQNNSLLNDFLTEYRKVHNELSVEKLTQARYKKQKDYIIKIFVDIEKYELEIADVFSKSRELFLKLKEDKRISLKFQDTVSKAVVVLGNGKSKGEDSKKYKANDFDDVLNKK